MKRLLVVAPHADDAELGCGGYISRVVQEGGQAHIAVVAASPVFFRHLDRVVLKEERLAELVNSAAVLGATQSCFMYPDGRLDTVKLISIIEDIEMELDKFQPTEVLIPLPSSHQDHGVVYRACMAALRPSKAIASVQLIAAYEYPATSWGEGADRDPSKGGMYVELAPEHMALKQKALMEYKTQVREGGHPWSLEAALAMARMRGIEAGVQYAELFHTMRSVRRVT